MGCAPPEKRHKSIPAVNVIPQKTPTFSPKSSHTSGNIPQTNQNEVLQVPIPQLPSNQSLKSNKKSSKSTSGKLQEIQALTNSQRFSYEHQQTIRNTSPNQKARPNEGIRQRSEKPKIVSVHSLDIVSRIKAPKNSGQQFQRNKTAQKEQKTSKVEDVNITFNCNDFAVSQSKAKTASLVKGRRWREEALINELQTMNNQNFRQITIDSHNYN